MTLSRRIAYLSLQAVVDGQDTWAAVTEIIAGWESEGWTVDRFFPDYAGGAATGVADRLAAMREVQRRLAERIGDYDAVYIRAHPLASRTAKRARRRGVPVVQECNGPYEDLFIAWPRTRIARPWFEHVQRSQYRDADAIIAVSEGLAQWLRAESGNPHVVTSGNGANVDVFSPDAPRRPGLPDRYGVFFGQFAAWQGIGTLLDAVESSEWPGELPLVFVGDGAMRGEIESLAARLPRRVSYLGRLPYRQVAGVAAHAVLSLVPMDSPEREDKFSPLKLYESMACGVPVIASDVVGIREVVTECGCGVLVSPGDARAISGCARDLVSSAEVAAGMGRRGRDAAVGHYSWKARADQRREVVEEAIARAASAGD